MITNGVSDVGEIKDWRMSSASNDAYTAEQQSILDELERQHQFTMNQLRPKKKEANVIGRGIIGGIVAGPAGAVVGALSAIDKNRKNK